MNITEILLTWS